MVGDYHTVDLLLDRELRVLWMDHPLQNNRKTCLVADKRQVLPSERGSLPNLHPEPELFLLSGDSLYPRPEDGVREEDRVALRIESGVDLVPGILSSTVYRDDDR